MKKSRTDRTLLRDSVKPADSSAATTLKTFFLRHAQVLLESLGRLTRTPFATFMTAAVIGIALALPTGLHIVLKNIQQLSGGWDGAAQISLFLKTSTSEEQAQDIVRRLERMPEIATVKYISRDQALQEFSRLSGFGEALKSLDDNPLPSVVVVTPALLHTSPAAAEKLLTRLQDLQNVDLAQLDMQWIQRLYAIMDIIQRTVEVLTILLALGVVLVVGNTIRLAIQNRRDEIIIIKLIGGTDGFIRRPFLYSGFWYGLLGGSVAFVFVTASVVSLSGPIEQLAGLYRSQFNLHGLDLSTTATLLGAGVILGLAGSWLAVGRHLREIEPT